MMDKPNENELQKIKVEAFKARLKKREIWVNGPITNALVEILYTNLIKLQEDAKNAPISVVINSRGGNLFESVVATDMMGTISCPIKTVALADAISGGFILFMGGSQRICHEHSCLMMHDVAGLMQEKFSEIERHIDYIKMIKKKMARLFSYQTKGKTTSKYWMELFNSGQDKWFSVEEALKLGIVHKVIKRKEMIDPNFTMNEPYTWDIIDFRRAQQ